MSRFTRALLAALAAFCVMVLAAAPSATAGSQTQLGSTLGELWTTVLQTPGSNNPFSGGSTCVQLPDGQLAPFGPTGSGPCTVQLGTGVFVAARSQECSTFAPDDCHGPGYSQLVTNAQSVDAKYTTHSVAVDGQPVPVTEVLTGPLNVVLPENNIFGLPAGTPGLSAAHGWVVLLNALSRGKHKIQIHLAGAGFNSATTTTVFVV